MPLSLKWRKPLMMSPLRALKSSSAAEKKRPQKRAVSVRWMFAGLDEEGLVLAGGGDFALEVLGEFGAEDGVRELLQQDGREIEIEVGGNAVALEVVEHAQQRQVGFGGSFEQPLHAMRPAAVVDDVGQVGVQSDGRNPTRLEWLSH